MPCPCSHLYSTKFSSGGGGHVPRKLSHSLNSSVHNPSLVQTMGTCKAEGEQPVLLPAVAGLTLPGHCPAPGAAQHKDPPPAGEAWREALQGSWVAAIWSSLRVFCTTDLKANCFPAAARPRFFGQNPSCRLDVKSGWKSLASSSLHPLG